MAVDSKGRQILTQEEYDKLVAHLKERQHYDDLSDEDKARFDETIDSRITVGKKSDGGDSDEEADMADKGVERERERGGAKGKDKEEEKPEDEELTEEEKARVEQAVEQQHLEPEDEEEKDDKDRNDDDENFR